MDPQFSESSSHGNAIPLNPFPTALELKMRQLAESNATIKSFCAHPAVRESRQILKIDPQHMSGSVTQSTLAGQDLLCASPLVFANHEDGSLQVLHHVGRKLAGHAGMLHGGMAAMLLDEAMGRACFPLLPQQIGVTVHMELSYHAPIALDSIILITCRTEKIEGRKAWTEATIEDSQTGQLFVEATGHFVQPRWADTMSKVL